MAATEVLALTINCSAPNPPNTREEIHEMASSAQASARARFSGVGSSANLLPVVKNTLPAI